jgi:SRSO17 transposase
MAVMDAAADWARGLDELVERIAPRFCRIEPRRRVRAYLQGLLAPIERRTAGSWPRTRATARPRGCRISLPECAGMPIRWAMTPACAGAGLRGYVVAELGDADAVLVLDETGFIKKGSKSVGVQRQYSGTWAFSRRA